MSAQLNTIAPSLETTGKSSTRYSGFNGQFINGRWRPGGSGRTLRDRDPYTGDTLAEIAMADNSDLNESYESAHRAQPQWATMLPAERAGIMLRGRGHH